MLNKILRFFGLMRVGYGQIRVPLGDGQDSIIFIEDKCIEATDFPNGINPGYIIFLRIPPGKTINDCVTYVPVRSVPVISINENITNDLFDIQTGQFIRDPSSPLPDSQTPQSPEQSADSVTPDEDLWDQVRSVSVVLPSEDEDHPHTVSFHTSDPKPH